GTRHREQAGEQRQTRIQGDRRIQVQGHSRLKVQKDLHHQAAASQRLQSGEAARLSARASLQLATTGSLRVQSEGDLTVRGKQDHNLHAGGELHLQGAKEIDVTAKGPIVIEQNGGGVRIEPSGEIHLYGNSITFEGAVSYAGQVHYDLGAPSLPGSSRPKAPLNVREIQPLVDEQDTPSPQTRDLEIEVTNALLERFGLHLNLLDKLAYELISDTGEVRKGRISDGWIRERKVGIRATFRLRFTESVTRDEDA
ncbi:MAG: DUF2345 domain-containing protein, partial [Gammaproteobacteria bacterium]